VKPVTALTIAGSALALTACASNAIVQSRPAVTSYAANQEEIPGRWAVLLDTGTIPTSFSSGEYTCSGWTYTVESEDGFRESVLATLDAAFEDVQLMQDMPSPAAAGANGYRGTVSVEVNTYSAFLSWLQGFWAARARSEATIRLGVDVRAADGTRLVGFTEGAQRSSDAESGGCEAGSEAIARALETTTETVMEQMVERLQDSPQIRDME
jgi:hypothetical protein